MIDVVNDLIVKMKSETARVKRNQQLYAIPKKLDGLRAHQTFYYYTEDRKRQVVNQANQICIEIDNIKPFSMVPVNYKNFQNSITPLIDLIEYNKIYPILLFLDGRFIPWECIDLIVSYEKYYLFVHNLQTDLNLIVRTVETIDMVLLPSNVIYSIGVHDEGKKDIFSFTELGEYTRDLDFASHIIYMENDEIDLTVLENPESLFEFALNYNKQLFADNFISFTNNLYDDTIELEVLGTYAKITSEGYSPYEGTLETNVDKILDTTNNDDMSTNQISDNDNIYDVTTSTGSFSDSGVFEQIIGVKNFKSLEVSNGTDTVTYVMGGDINAFKASVDAMLPKSVDDPEVLITMTVNTFDAEPEVETNKYVWLVFSNPSESMVTSPINNLSQVDYDSVKADIQAFLNDEASAPEYIKTLVEDFDFSADRTKLYAENRAAIIKYILEYRQDLFTELYELGLNYFTIEVSPDWIQQHRDETGYMVLNRRSSTGYDYYVIMFVNGEVYQYMRHGVYKANKFLCPVASLDGSETVELMFFRNATEYAITNTFKKDEYLPLHEDYYNTRAKIFCRETIDDYFKFPEDGNQHFPIDFALEPNEDGDLKVVFPDDFYYGKEVVVAPDNTFRYFSYYLDEEDTDSYKVSLSTKFNYCNEYDRYLVFKNGRRLTKDYYRLTIPCRTSTPFYNMEIYLAVPLSPGDRLDVFYLPVKIKDLDFETVTIPEDGYITFDKNVLPYVLGKDIYTFWVNGRKIPNNQIKVVNSNSIQLLSNVGSTLSFRVTSMGDPIPEIEDVRKSIDNVAWDTALAEGDYTKLLKITKPKIKDDEFDVYQDSVPIISIMWELIREHYVANPYVDIPGAFVYDYKDVDDSGIIIGTTDNGYEIIDALNSNPERMDNLDIDRYYP